ncbi:ribosome biogenesis GTPase Der [Bacillota bacterium LX-D]|nr:ribosome biogenesis GTPase Der [Bacillota bacterium LX-D]
MAKPIVAIVGRPNVGKSTLFNRITGERVAIVEDISGVTRDRIYRDAEWQDNKFTLIDTGGIQWEDNKISTQVKKQAEIAITEADIIIFLTDAKTGLLPDDYEVASILRKTDKPVVLAVNKVENFSNPEFYEFYKLGLGEPIPVSAIHGMNTGDLLDAVIANFPAEKDEENFSDTIKIAVIGRPNVGKSTMTNFLLGEERVIVSDIPGTTRDAIDSVLSREGKEYLIIDTAGMRKRAKIYNTTERYSVLRSLKAVERADVVLILIDATEGVTEQDKKIAGFAHENGKGSIIVVNKWDLVIKNDKTINKFDERIREELSFMQYAPIMYVSALTGQRVWKIFDLIDFVAEQSARRISTNLLNKYIAEIMALNPPPGDKGKYLKILYATQSGVKPPTFILFVNDPELMHFSYQRYIENQLRKSFGFEGNPIRLITRKKKNHKED